MPDISTRPPARRWKDKLDSLAVIKMLLQRGASPNPTLIKIIPARGVLDGADRTMGPGSTPSFSRGPFLGCRSDARSTEKGANPKMKTAGRRDCDHDVRPVQWVSGWKTRGTEAESIESIKMLLDLGLDINAVAPKTGEPPAWRGRDAGADLIVQFLADHGATSMPRTSKNRTPLDTANGVGASLGGVRGSPHDSTAALLAKLGGVTGQNRKSRRAKRPPRRAQ